MLNRVSVAIIAGLTIVCIGLLLKNSQKSEALKLSANSSTKSTVAASEEVSGTLAEKIGALGGVSVSSFDQKNFFANEYVTTFRIVQRNNNKDVAYRRLNESRDKVLALLKSHSVDEKEYEFLSSTLQKKWSYVESKRSRNERKKIKNRRCFICNKSSSRRRNSSRRKQKKFLKK